MRDRCSDFTERDRIQKAKEMIRPYTNLTVVVNGQVEENQIRYYYEHDEVTAFLRSYDDVESMLQSLRGRGILKTFKYDDTEV